MDTQLAIAWLGIGGSVLTTVVGWSLLEIQQRVKSRAEHRSEIWAAAVELITAVAEYSGELDAHHLEWLGVRARLMTVASAAGEFMIREEKGRPHALAQAFQVVKAWSDQGAVAQRNQPVAALFRVHAAIAKVQVVGDDQLATAALRVLDGLAVKTRSVGKRRTATKAAETSLVEILTDFAAAARKAAGRRRLS